MKRFSPSWGTCGRPEALPLSLLAPFLRPNSSVISSPRWTVQSLMTTVCWMRPVSPVTTSP